MPHAGKSSAALPADAPLDHVAFAADERGRASSARFERRTRSRYGARRRLLFYRAGDETVEITAETDRPDTFWCPMHPNVRAPGADEVPNLRDGPGPDRAAPGGRIPARRGRRSLRRTGAAPPGLTLRIRDPDTGRDVAMFAEAHQRLLHLFIIGRDLQLLRARASGENRTRLRAGDTACRPGAYMVIADFVPGGGYPQMVHRAIVTPGYRASPFAGSAVSSTKTCRRSCVRGCASSCASKPPGAGRKPCCASACRRRTGELPSPTCSRIWAPPATCLIVSPDLTHSVHAHPDVEPGPARISTSTSCSRSQAPVQGVAPGAAGRHGGVGAVRRANPALNRDFRLQWCSSPQRNRQ